MRVDWLPDDHPLAPALRPLAEAAAARLGLERHLASLTLWLDDLTADERIWVTTVAAAAAAPGGLPGMALWFHPDHFLRDHAPGVAQGKGLLDWELRSGLVAELCDPEAFSPRKAERILYHQFLMVRDLRDGTVSPAEVPSAVAEAFQEAWAVTLDGRLKRAILPGYSLAERRRRFVRVFSAGGVLLPQHWQIFHALWEWEAPEQDRLLEMLVRLPSLPGSQSHGR
jgi:hypothetical protein